MFMMVIVSILSCKFQWLRGGVLAIGSDRSVQHFTLFPVAARIEFKVCVLASITEQYWASVHFRQALYTVSCCCTYRIQGMRASVPSLNSTEPAYISDTLQPVSISTSN